VTAIEELKAARLIGDAGQGHRPAPAVRAQPCIRSGPAATAPGARPAWPVVRRTVGGGPSDAAGHGLAARGSRHESAATSPSPAGTGPPPVADKRLRTPPRSLLAAAGVPVRGPRRVRGQRPSEGGRPPPVNLGYPVGAQGAGVLPQNQTAGGGRCWGVAATRPELEHGLPPRLQRRLAPERFPSGRAHWRRLGEGVDVC